MLQQIARTILSSLLIFQISAGQNAFFNNDNPLSSGISGSNSGVFDPNVSQQFSSFAPLSKAENYQTPTASSSFVKASFLPSWPSSTISSTTQMSPSPVENFLSEFNSAVHTSKILPDIFDLRELSPAAFSKSLYSYVYASAVEFKFGFPHYLANLVAGSIKEGIDSYTLPVVLDIFGNAIAKYLFAKGTLDLSNAAYLAKKYAKIVEGIAERKWTKEIPESKFLVLEDSFVEYMTNIDNFNLNTFEDLAMQFSNAVKRAAAKF